MRRALLCIAVLLTACRGTPPPADTVPAISATSTTILANAVLVRVIDGDTIDITIAGSEERVRLIGIDTPETKKPNTPVQCFGPEASEFTHSLLPEGTPLHLERDAEARDPYGRLLAYVYRVEDGLFVNMEIMLRGYARPLSIPPNINHADEFVAAARDAREANAGLWNGCTG
jgi:micrococcal nuclease